MTGKTFSAFFFLGYYGIQFLDKADNIFFGLLYLRVIGGNVGAPCPLLFLLAVAWCRGNNTKQQHYQYIFHLSTRLLLRPFLDVAFMGFLLLVVVDAHEEEVVGVLCHLGGILLLLDLVDGAVRILVVFQFEDDGG